MLRAYTLIELIIVIGILAILTGLSSLSIVSFGSSSEMENSKTIVESALREARSNSTAVLDDKAWGVHLESERVIIYPNSGSGYVPNTPGSMIRPLARHTSQTWNLVGGDEIEFAKRTGRVSNFGVITFSGSTLSGQTIVVNEEGMIE
jgi:prepilin-type N-terminal cleavage/methylation domain-containing protein